VDGISIYKSDLNTHTLLKLTAQLNSMTVAGGAGSAIHLQSEMQHSPLAISSVSEDSDSAFQTTCTTKIIQN